MDASINHQLDFNEGCDNGKQCNNSFQKGNPKKMFKTFLELVHTYLCSLMKTTSMGRA
jgi:hypothetical protein